MKRPRRDAVDAAIVAERRRHEEAEPDISTERLMETVRGDIGADVDRQIESPQHAGMLKLEQR